MRVRDIGSSIVQLSVNRFAHYSAGNSIRSSRNPPTPAKNTSAMRIPGSRFTSGTRSVAAT